MKRRNNAFSLIELLVVTGIIGLVAALTLPAIKKVRNYAKEIKEISTLDNICNSGLQSYHDTHGKWLDTSNDGSQTEGGYRINPNSIEEAVGLTGWRDPYRVDKIEDARTWTFAGELPLGMFGLKNEDHPPNGYGRMFVNFVQKIPGTDRYVLSGLNIDPVVSFNGFFPDMLFPVDSGLEFAVISAGIDGVIDGNPSDDIIYLKRERNMAELYRR